MAADPRFFAQAGPFTLAQVLAASGAEAADNSERQFTGIGSLTLAVQSEVSFMDGARNRAALRVTNAGAVILRPSDAGQVPSGCLCLLHPNPSLAFSRLALLFHPPAPLRPGRHPTAQIDATAVLAAEVEVGPFSVIGARAEIGPGCFIGPHVVIGPGVVLGAGCRLHAHVSISHANCGSRVVLHPGARIGQEGFGFTMTPEGGFETVPQLGIVRLGDAVEIGANSCVDRGSQGDTVLGAGTRVDNMVQVGHNVRTGRGCVLVAQVGISGSAQLGDHVSVGGQVGIGGHLHIGSGARIAAQAGVMRDVPAGSEMMGSPALPAKEAFRGVAAMRRLAAGSRGGKEEGG